MVKWRDSAELGGIGRGGYGGAVLVAQPLVKSDDTNYAGLFERLMGRSFV